MASFDQSPGARPLSSLLLFINLSLYAVAAAIAAWGLNYAVVEAPRAAASGRDIVVPARLFPMYYPGTGNMATGFFIVFSIVASIVGVAACLAGIHGVRKSTPSSLLSASSSALMAWTLTLLAAGVACKEISMDDSRTRSLIALEGLIIILSGTQLLCTAAIHAGWAATMRPTSILLG